MKGKVKIISGLFAVFAVLVIIFGSSTIINKTGVTNIQDNAEAPITYGSREEDYTITVEGTTLPFTINGYFLNNGRKEDGIYCRIDEDGSSVGDTSVKYEISVTMSETNGHFKETYISIPNGNYKIVPSAAEGVHIEEVKYEGNTEKIKLSESMTQGADLKIPVIFKQDIYNNGAYPGNFTRTNAVTFSGIFVQEDGTEIPFNKSIEYTIDWDVKIDNVTNYNIEAKTGDKFITNGNEYIAVLYVKSGSSKEEQGWGVKHRWLYKLSNFKIGNTLPKSIDVYTDSPSGDTPTVVSDSNYDKTNDVLTYKIDHIRADGGFPRDDAGAYLVVKYDKSALDAEGSQKSTTIHGITQIKAYVNPKINHTDRTPIINDDDNKETEIEQEKGYELNSMYSNPMEHSFELLCNSYDGEIIRYGVEVVDASKLNTAYYYNNFNVDAGFKELHRVDVIVPNILSQVCVKYDYTDENGELKEKSFSTAETAEHISMNDFTTYTGVFLSDNMWQVLGEDGYFKIIDDITGNVIETITSTDMPEYTKSKELSNGTISCHQGGYTYLFNEEDTYRRLRYETSQVKIVGTIAFNAFVKIHNDKMCKTAGNTAGKIDYETFQKLEKVWVYGNTHYKIGSNTEYETSTYKDYGSTDYVYGALNAGFGPDTEINGTTIVTKNFTYGIYPGSFERWSNAEVIAGYYNPVIIVEFPSGIKNVSIKNLKIKDGSKGTNKIDSIKKSNVTTVTGIDGEKHKRVYFYVTGKIKEAVEFTFDAVMTPDSQKIIDDEITSQPCKGYIVNTFDGKYESGHIVEDIGIVSWAGHEEDVNDINLNGDKTDNANYAYCNFNYTAPVGLATIVSVSDGNDVVQSPGIISVPKGVTQVDIINSYMNFSDNDVSDFRYIGRIPYEGNTSVHKGEDMNSEFNTTLTGPITIPDSFKNLGTVTVLYSTLDKNLESITSVDQFDAQNWEWRTEGNVSNWSNIKSFMIKLDGVVPKKTSYDFTYTINLPEEANQKYGQKTYAANAYISTSNSTTDGPAGSGKVGIMFDTSTRIDIALLKKDKDDNTILSGAEYDFYRKDGVQIYSEETKEYVDKLSYSISNNSSNPTKIKGLFPDTEYVLEEKTAPSNYKKQNILFKFDDQGNLEVIKGVEGFEGDMISVSKNNSSDTTYNVNIDIPEPKDEVNYTVQYYFQNDTGKYPTTPNAKLKSGPAVIGSTIARDKVQLDPTKVDGRPTGNYVLDDETKNTSEKTDNSLTIVADETKNIFKVYFSKTYTVTYKKGDHGTFSDDKHPGLVYGVKTPNCTKNTATEHDTGYVFTGWKPTVADTVTKDAEYVAQWAPDGDTAYKIEFYYQVNGNYKDTPDSTQNRTGTAFTNAVATDADKTPAAGKTGYVFDSGYAGNVLEKEIAANGSTVLKVYFKKAYTVTYKKGDHGTFSDDVHSGLSYGVKTPDCTKNTATEHDQGYVFNGWKPTVENTVTKDMIYIAQWIPDPNTKYSIQFYYQVDGNYKDTPDSTQDRTGTAFTNAVATDADKTPAAGKTGYVFDSGYAGNVLEKEIAANGSTVLKVYFKKAYTVTYKKGDHGTFSDDVHSGLSYGVKTPDCTKNTATDHDAGYVFNGWKPTVENTVTKDMIYIAQWIPDPNTKYSIQFYYQVDGNYKDTPDSTQDRTGTAFTKAVATDADKTPAAGKTGYVFDSGYAGNVLEKEIAANGSTILKVYFKLNEASYKVQYLYEDINGNYGQKTERPEDTGRKGQINSEVSVTADDLRPVIANYELSTTHDTTERKATVKADGTTILKVYFDLRKANYRVQYWYQDVNGQYSQKAERPQSDARQEKIGKTVTITDDDKNPKDSNYQLSSHNENERTGVVLSNNALVLKVYFDLKEADYRVQYWYQDVNGQYNQKAERPQSAARKDKIGKNVSVNEDDLKPLFENYELSTTHDTSERSGDVKADNSLILKVYFDLKEAKYNVEYYYQNPNKTYSKRADRPSAERKDKIGKTVNVTDADKDPIYEHYKLSTSNKGISSDTVKSDNSTVLKVYFDLEDAPYTVEYYYENLNGKYNQKNERKPRSARDLIGATVAVTNEDKNPLFDEYELSKTHDTTEQTGVVDANGTTVLKVYFDLKKVNYQVRYFYLNDNGVYPSAPVSTKNAGPVKVGTTITRNDVNLDPTRVENAPAGKYLLDDEDTISTERTDSNLTITPTERDNVFNVYFTKGYTVTYKPGTKGTFETKSKEDIPHGTLTPLLVDEKTHKPGYEFTGWLEEETTTPLLQDGTISKAKVTHDITYVAQWKALEVPYKVEFYYEENGSYPNKPYATVDNRMALTDTNVSLKTPTKVNDFTVTVSDSKVKDEDISRPKTDRNYKYDTEASNVVSANVEGDGSTVLKVYFKEIPVNYDLDVVLKNTADKTLTNNSFTITRQKASETENVIWDSKAVTDNTEIEERGTIIDTYTYRITEDEAPNLRYVNVLNGKFVQVTVAISDEGKASVKEWGVYDSNGKVADTDEVYSYVGAPVVSSANGVDKIFVKIINPVRYTVEVKKLDTADDPKAVPDTEFTIKSEVINSQNAAHSEEIVTESKDGLTMSESGEVNGLTNDRGCIRYEETWVDADEYTYEIVENRAAGNQMVNILEGYKVVVKVRVSADGLLEVVKQDGRNFAIVATAPGKVVTDDLYSYVNVSAENNSLNAIINTTGKLNIDIDNPVRFNLDIDKRDSAGNVIDNAKFTISRRDLDAPLFDNKSANGDVEVVEDPIKVGTYEYYIYENQASSEKYENILKSRYIKLILDVKGNGHVDIVEQDGKPFKVYDKLGAEITDQENVLDFIEVWPEVAETGDKAGITTIKVKITNPVKYFVNITTATTAYDANKNIDEYFLDKTDVIVNRNDTTIYSAQPTKDTELTEAPIRAGEYEYYISQTTTKSDKFVNPLENKFLKVTVTVSPDGKLAITKQEMFEGTIGDEHNKRLTNDEAEKYVKVSVSNPDNGESMLDILIIDPVRFSVEVKKVDTDNKPIENTQISINSAVVDEQNAVHKDEVIESAQSKDSIGITAEGIVAGTTNSEGVIKYEETWVESNESNKLSNENRDFYTYEITEIEPAGNQYVNVLEGYKVIVRVKVDPNGNVKLVDKNGTEYGKNAKYKYTIVKIADGSEVPTTDIAYKYVNVSVESNSVNAIIKGTDELKVNVTNPVRFDFDINKKSTDGLPLAGTKFTVTREGKDTPVFEGEPNEAVEIKEDPINSGIYTYLIRENQTNKTVGNRYVNVLEGRYIKLRVKVNANGVIDILDLNSNNSDYFEVYEESGKKVTDDNVLRYISVKSIDEDGDGVYKLDVNVTNPVRYEIDIITKDTLNQFLNGVNVSLYKVVGDENKDLYTDDATDVAVVKEVEKLEIPADAGTYTYYVKENHAPTERYINVLENKYIEIKLTVAPNGMLTETHKLYEGEIGKGKQVTTGEVLERYSVVADNSGDVSRLNVTIVNPVRFVVEVDKYDTANAPLTDTTFEIESPIIEDQAYEHNNEKINGIDDDGITTDGVVTGKTDNAIEKSKDGNMQRARISYEETWVDANDGNGYYTYYIRETKTAGAQYVNMLEGHKVVVRARVGADGTLTLVDKNGNAYAKDAEYKFTIETEAGQEITDTNNEMYKYVNISASNNKILATMNASIVNPVRYNIAVYETIYGDEKVKLNNIPVKVQSEFSGDTTLVTGSKENCNGYDYMEERAVWADTYEYRIFQLNEFNGVKVEDEFVNMLDGYYIGIDLYVPGNGDIKTISKDGDYTTVSYKLYKQTASGEYAEIDFNDTMVDDFVKVKITKDENNVCTLNIYIVTPEKYDFRLEKTDIDVLYSVNTYPEKYPEVSPNMNDVEFTVTVKDANGEIVLKDTKSGKDAKSEFATINTKSQLTKNVKGVDGILDFNNILIERCGTYTFEIEEVTPKVEGMIYKDKSEPIVLTADIVVENGKYVLKNMATKQAERYTIKEKTKLSGDQTQTVNVNVTNERIKGKYDLDLNKVNKFTGLPLDGAVYKVTVEQEGKEEKVLYLSNDDVLSMEQLIPYEEEESTSVNGTTSFKDIRIELPETYTIKIEEVKAPVIETEDGKKITFTKLDDVIELEVTTVIEGEFDDAHYVLGDIKLKEGNHDLISEKHSSKEEEKQNIGLRIENEYFDLALRQYVVDVNGTKFERKLDVNTDKLQSAEATDAEYKLNKNPQRAYAGQEVIYAIEVFNEGIIDGYAEEIMQYLPEGLEFVDDEFNKLYGWELNEDNTGVVTHALSKETNEEENLIAAYNKDAENEADRLSSKVIYLKLKVKEDVKLKSILTTVAEVTKYLANDRKESVDRDSYDLVTLPIGNDLVEYAENQEDDDDFEKLIIEEFDLAPVKFTKSVNGTEQKDRAPIEQLDETRADEYRKGIFNGFKYKNENEMLKLDQNDKIVYGIQVRNEGSVGSYATEVMDTIPSGLKFDKDSEINKKYGWKLLDADKNPTEDAEKAAYVVTDYLSEAKGKVDEETGKNSNWLAPLTIEGSDLIIDYKELEVEFIVTEPTSEDRIVKNIATIVKFIDDLGINVKDRDPEERRPDNVEKIYVNIFDLELEQVINSVEVTNTKTNEVTVMNGEEIRKLAKVDIAKSKLKNTNVKVEYKITIKNNGESAGYATEIKDYIPEGFIFDGNDNANWVANDGYVTTEALSNELLNPGDTREVTLVLRWNGSANVGVKENLSEISKHADKNKLDVVDWDSTPDNKVLEEDDIDYTSVILTVKTGSAEIAIMSIAIGFMVVTSLGITAYNRRRKA